jgi:hypothetical protein
MWKSANHLRDVEKKSKNRRKEINGKHSARDKKKFKSTLKKNPAAWLRNGEKNPNHYPSPSSRP